MSISDIAWGVAFAAPTFKAGTGIVMAQLSRPNFEAARRLFLLAPIAPLAATAIWAYRERPSLSSCIGVAALVGSLTILLTLETLRWVDILEKEHSKRNE